MEMPLDTQVRINQTRIVCYMTKEKKKCSNSSCTGANYVTINGDHIWSPFIVPGTTINVVLMVVPLSKFTVEIWSLRLSKMTFLI